MPEFLELIPPPVAWSRWMEALDGISVPLGAERIQTPMALDRVLAQDIESDEPLPAFRRSTVDGFAVRAEDTFGASAALPQYLKLSGEIRMGEPASVVHGPGEALAIHTGGMLPQGTDAVVMIENTQMSRQDEVEILRPVAVGENVLQVGEDLEQDQVAIAKGQRLRPQELAGLLALGRTEVMVARAPLVGIVATGDELVPPSMTPGPGQVRDINTPGLAALVSRAGGTSRVYGIVPDARSKVLAVTRQAISECDVLVISAGSSVSARDLTAEVINDLGRPGVIVHGIAFKPGKPTILALCGETPVIGLPGNPVSALVVAELFMTPLIRHFLGELRMVSGQVMAELTVNVPSQAGREDHLAVRLEETKDGWLAHPVYGRSNLIFTLVRADGLVRIPAESTGLAKGEQVTVRLT